MSHAPTLVLYTYCSKSALGDARWEDRSVPDYFYDDADAARRDVIALRDRLAGDPDYRGTTICLERVETVPMTREAIIALLNEGVSTIIGGYQVIEEIGVTAP